MNPKTLQEVTVATRDLYNKTLKSSVRMDPDTAIQMFLPLVQKEPALVPARERLRELEMHKLDTMGNGAVMAATILSLPTVFLKVRKLIPTDPKQALSCCEVILAKCLKNQFALEAIADAAKEASADFIGRETIALLRRFFPQNQGVQIFCAQYLIESGDPESGAKIYQDMLNRNPDNGKIKSLLREALAEASLKNDASKNKALQSRDSEEAVAQQLMDGTIHDAEQAKMLIEKYTQMLAQKDSVDVRRRLAEAYMVAKDYDNAITNMETVAQQLGAMDPALDKQIEKAYVAKFNTVIKELSDNPAAYENAEQQKAEFIQQRDAYILQKAEARAEAYPNDLQLHYDLALLYFAANMTEQALEQFQTARNHPQRKIVCAYYIGRCLAAKSMLDMAAEQILAAYQGIPKNDPMHKEVLYHLALILEQSDKKEEALARFKELYQEDIAYLDVEQHLQALSN